MSPVDGCTATIAEGAADEPRAVSAAAWTRVESVVRSGTARLPWWTSSVRSASPVSRLRTMMLTSWVPARWRLNSASSPHWPTSSPTCNAPCERLICSAVAGATVPSRARPNANEGPSGSVASFAPLPGIVFSFFATFA